jgi:GT2 family glycosyltransferase
MKKQYPLISIVVLNWNGRKILTRCLDAVFNQTYPNFEVILSDNGSTDGSVEFVRKNYPRVKIIENGRNLGCAEGNNVGMRIAKGKYICNLANDTKPDKNWLMEMFKVIESDEKIGAVGPKLVFMHNPKIINAAGTIASKDGVIRYRGWKEEDVGQYDKIEEVFAVNNVACMYRKKALEDVGLLDPEFFIYNEDADLGWRMRLRGWKSVYVPTAVVQHEVGATMGKYSEKGAYYAHRNWIWMIIKNFSLSSLILYSPFIIIWNIISVLRGLARGSLTNLVAIKDALKDLPRILKLRKEIQSKRKILEWKIRRFMVYPPYFQIFLRALRALKNYIKKAEVCSFNS